MGEIIYDVIILGGAGAGLTAAMYAARRKMKTLLITKDIGGQATGTDRIENYPGFQVVTGPKLMQRFQKQAIKSGAEIIFDETIGVEEKSGEKLFVVKNKNGEYFGKTIILSYGKTPRNLNVPGEEKFSSKGISYCASCDAPLFPNKIVAVVGGGNSAFDAALLLSKIAKKVYIIHRRGEFRAFEYLFDLVKKQSNVEFILNSTIKEIKGEERVKTAVLQNVETNGEREFQLDGIFVEIGSDVRTEFVKHLVKLDERGQVIINNNCETFYPDKDEVRPGIFAAGDLTMTPFKQIVVSAGEGCKAALQAYNFIHGLKPEFIADWVAKKNRPKE